MNDWTIKDIVLFKYLIASKKHKEEESKLPIGEFIPFDFKLITELKKHYSQDEVNYIITNKEDLIKEHIDGKIFTFIIEEYWETPQAFESDMLSAYQLASNYEADLYLDKRLLLSPLGFDYEENRERIRQNLGNEFIETYVNEKGETREKYNLRAYKNYTSKEIMNLRDTRRC